MAEPHRVLLGYDPREGVPYSVAVASILSRTSGVDVDLSPILLADLQGRGVYERETLKVDGRLWDSVSGAPMSTEHAIARFFTPWLCGYQGLAVSADCDILARADLAELFALAEPRYAVQVVKHQHVPTDGTKMDGQIQTAYARKNWSSVILWNCSHIGHRGLTMRALNEWPGRDLHAFRWLSDGEIGTLPADWNHLIGVNPQNPHAKLCHFTLGTPDMPGYEECEFADEWRAAAPMGVPRVVERVA